jgi:serine/threonine-protein kinase
MTRALGSRYALERVLGSGAMGQVWVARDQRTGERVAAKLLRQEFARDAEILTRFVQERSILLDLVHPNIVRVRDLVVEGDDLAIVMDLVEGADLRVRLRAAGTLPAAEAARVVADVLAALAAAHQKGVLHRDVKPDNVLLTAEEPVGVLLSDFGIARLAQETTVRMTGVLGTADYMAPEIFTMETVSAASDVYAAGIVLYELVAGRTPFTGGGTGFAIANRHVTALPPPVPGLPAPLEALTWALLDKDPSRRPPAAAAAAALRDLLPELDGLAALPVVAEPTSWEQAAVGPHPAFGVLGHRAVEELDPGRTNVKGAAEPTVAGPAPAVTPESPWVAPHGEVDADVAAGRTQLRTPRSRPADAPVRPAAVEEADPRRIRRRWAVGLGSVAAAAAVAGVVVAVSGGGSADSDRDTSATTSTAVEPVTALGPSEELPSGLTTVREATYDPESGTLTTTITWSASGDAALAGPLFEAVPAVSDDGPCPTVNWSVPAVRDVTAGVPAAACGWQVAVDVPAGSDATASYTVSLPIDGEGVAQALRDRLASEGTLTGEALDGLVATPVYPAQRLDDLEVQIGAAVRVGAPVELVVLPVWRGTQAADNVSVVFSSRSPQPTVLLDQLGGQLEVRTDDCSGALAFTDGVPYANTVGSNCSVSVRLGDLDARSRSFDVLQNSID